MRRSMNCWAGVIAGESNSTPITGSSTAGTPLPATPRQAKETVAAGFTALKFDPFAHVHYGYGDDLSDTNQLSEGQKQLALDLVAGVAEAVGPDVPLAIETHAFLNGPTAVEMAHRLAQLGFNCMWYEEPALPEYPDAIADIRRQIPLPVCVGERLHSRFMAKRILDTQAADILMPDITRCGGISEMRKIANMAEAYNVPIAPHNPNGPISTIASAHTMATIPNFFRQEFYAQGCRLARQLSVRCSAH